MSSDRANPSPAERGATPGEEGTGERGHNRGHLRPIANWKGTRAFAWITSDEGVWLRCYLDGDPMGPWRLMTRRRFDRGRNSLNRWSEFGVPCPMAVMEWPRPMVVHGLYVDAIDPADLISVRDGRST